MAARSMSAIMLGVDSTRSGSLRRWGGVMSSVTFTFATCFRPTSSFLTLSLIASLRRAGERLASGSSVTSSRWVARILRQMRDRLLAWQWSDYTAKHRDRGNLLLHAIAVPLFLLGTLALVTREGVAAVFAVAGMGVSVLLQGRGHRRERETPAPFEGAGDFVSRFFVEQWGTFPRFVLSGGWLRNFRGHSL